MYICHKDTGLLTMEVSAISNRGPERKQREKVATSSTGSCMASFFPSLIENLFRQSNLL